MNRRKTTLGSLAGTCSLADPTEECPLAYPKVDVERLIFPELPREAVVSLTRTDAKLAQALVTALSGVSTDYIELKNGQKLAGIPEDPPAVLRAVLAKEPHCLNKTSSQLDRRPSNLQLHQVDQGQPMLASSQDNLLMCHSNKAEVLTVSAPRKRKKSTQKSPAVEVVSHSSVAGTQPSVIVPSVSKKRKLNSPTAVSAVVHKSGVNELVNGVAGPEEQAKFCGRPFSLVTALPEKAVSSSGQNKGMEKSDLSVVKLASVRKNRSKSQESESGHVGSKKKKGKTGVILSPSSELPTPVRTFDNLLENIFDHADEHDLLSVSASTDQAMDPAALLPAVVLSQLHGEVFKLKSEGLLDKVKHEELSKVLAVMDKHVLDASSLQLDVLPEDEDTEPAKWRKLAKERVSRALDAALVILIVGGCQFERGSVYQEESIETLIQVLNFQLQCSIFPEYDSYYRLTSEKKEGIVVSKMKRRALTDSQRKDVVPLYNKICQLLQCLSDFVEVHRLPDSIILQISSLATATFFVENVSTLQLNALLVVRAVFSRYAQHQQVILSDIFDSLARLPSGRQSLRSYRLSSELRIQMVTALVLQLIQSTVTRPFQKAINIHQRAEVSTDGDPDALSGEEDKESLVIMAYESSVRSAQTFLSAFLKKCHCKEENDFRPLFENFVQDLLTCLHSPQWPAAQVLLTVLGPLLVAISNKKGAEVSLRVAALDHLGTIAARLRKDECSEQDEEALLAYHTTLQEIKDAEREASLGTDIEEDDDSFVKRIFIEHLHHLAGREPAFRVAKDYYLAQWIHRNHIELKHLLSAPTGNVPEATIGLPSCEQDYMATDVEQEAERARVLDHQRAFLFSLGAATAPGLSAKRPPIELSEESLAMLCERVTSSQRQHNFQGYLRKILMQLAEVVVAVRTKAMKALATIINADPSVLMLGEVQKAVHARLRDPASSMREATVDLIGKFVLLCPDLTIHYYPMLSERISDSGVSVRKRVIKIMRDICVQQPEFPHIPKICLQMIMRLKDEDGSKRLVRKVFQEMWFSPVEGASDGSNLKLLQRVKNIVGVVAECHKDMHEWMEELVRELLGDSEDPSHKAVLKVCHNIVDCLVSYMLTLQEEAVSGKGPSLKSNPNRELLVSCISTLCLFTQAEPTLAIQHATCLEPYLRMDWQMACSSEVFCQVVQILQLVLPLVDHPSESFLANVEEQLVEVVFSAPQDALIAGISCLATIVNKITHNYKIVYECFRTFLQFLHRRRAKPSQLIEPAQKLLSLRAAIAVGVISRFFDHATVLKSDDDVDSVTDKVFGLLVTYVDKAEGALRIKALASLGHFFISCPKMMLEDQSRELYSALLEPSGDVALKLQVLKNLGLYLAEDEKEMVKKSREERKQAAAKGKKSSATTPTMQKLNEWDSQSLVSSSIIQIYLKLLVQNVLHPVKDVRLATLRVIGLVFKHGLVHPFQFIVYLIAAGADVAEENRAIARTYLLAVDKKNPGYLVTVALDGFRKAFELRVILSKNCKELCRGCDLETGQAVLSQLYLLLRGNKQHRRGFILSLLGHYSKVNNLKFLLFIADNLAGFPYSHQDEPLFVIHHITKIISIMAADSMQQFKELMGFAEVKDDDEWVNCQALQASEQGDLAALKECHLGALTPGILLSLREYLKTVYSLSDGKCHRYQPSEMLKVNERAVGLKDASVFKPQPVVKCVLDTAKFQSKLTRDKIIKHFVEFYQAMCKLDPNEDDSAEEDPPAHRREEEEGRIGNGTSEENGAEAANSSVIQQARHSRADSRSDKPKSKLKSKNAKEKKKKRRKLSVQSDSSEDC